MALHADDAADRVDQLITLTERLTGIMQEDMADLEARRPSLARAEELGRPKVPRKAIIFTESRKTQMYLLRVLADSPFAEKIVLFNARTMTIARRRSTRPGWPAIGVRTGSAAPARPTCDLRLSTTSAMAGRS